MNKNFTGRLITIIVLSILTGLGAGFGLIFIPAIASLVIGVQLVIALAMFVGVGVIVGLLLFSLSILIFGKLDTKTNGKVQFARMERTLGMVSNKEAKEIAKEKKETMKKLNREHFARRQNEKAMKNSDKF